MLHFLSIIQGGVHISIAFRIRDTLYRFCCGFSERKRGIYAVDDAQLALFSRLFPLVLLFLPFLAFLLVPLLSLLHVVFQAPKAKTCDCRWNPYGDG